MKIFIQNVDELTNQLPLENHILFVMPSTDLPIAERCAALMSSRSGMDGTILIVNDTLGDGFVRVVNRVFKLSDAEFFGYVAQDAFAGRAWLQLAVGTLEHNEANLLAFNDGKWHGLLAAFGLVRRNWAETIYDGDLFYSGYQRHYADAELTLIAKSQKSLCYNPRSVLVEVDWEKDAKPVDANDKNLFKLRAQNLFDGRCSDHRYTSIFSRKHNSQ